MDDHVRSFYYFGCFGRLASIIFTICVFISSNVFCSENNTRSCYQKFANEILNKVEFPDRKAVINQFNNLKKITEETQDSLSECRQFLLSFLDALNKRYGLSLSMKEACYLIKTNIDELHLTKEEKDYLILSAELFDNSNANQNAVLYSLQMIHQNIFAGPHLYLPIIWNWFGSEKKKKDLKLNAFPQLTINSEHELPSNCYFGACEVFAGALIAIIPHPVTIGCGYAMIVDGGRRIVDGVIQLGDERRLDPGYVPPRPNIGLD